MSLSPVALCRSVPSHCVALLPRTGVPCPFVAQPAIPCRPWLANRVALSPTTFVAQLHRAVLPFVAWPATPCRPWLINHVPMRAKSPRPAVVRLGPLDHSVAHARSAESTMSTAS
ncbi:hypothetical protein K438DRAFT_1976050 [Mycena galopus ATCC 62051]|nr:hypothetical protein K438DRAFT_1976050 [Mycena galopus ATCC 62051]